MNSAAAAVACARIGTRANDDQELAPAKSLVMTAYYNYNQRCNPEDNRDDANNTDFLDRIDQIDSSLIAKFNMKEALDTAPMCCKKGLTLAFDKATSAPMLDENSEAVRANLKRKGEPSTIRNLEAMAVIHLASDAGGNLLERYTGSREPGGTMFCGAFFVEKKSENGAKPKLRVIADARVANARMSAADYTFNLFTLSTLLFSLGSMYLHTARANGPWYAVVTDFRHWFHQLPLREDLKRLFVFKLKTGKWFQPRAVPMGWILAPYIAQCCTWTVILGSNRQNNVPPQENKLLGLKPDTFESLTSPPPFLPIEGGGIIAVILDNILITTPSKVVAECWKSRLIKQGHALRARFRSEPPDSMTPKVDLVTLSPGGGTSFEFLGVKWGWDSHHIEVNAAERIPGMSDDNKIWIGTHRMLASALGKLLWFYRVTEEPMFTQKMDAFRKLYKIASPPNHTAWDDRVELDEEEITALKRYWDERRNSKPVKAKVKKLTTWNPGYAVSDASRSATNNRISVVTYSGDNLEAWQQHDVIQHEYDYIGVAELRAIWHAVCLLIKEDSDHNILIIATDSMTAKHWVENQVANNDEANHILHDLYVAKLTDRRQIFMTYVSTDDNAADSMTRENTDKEINMKRIVATRRCLEQAATLAKDQYHIKVDKVEEPDIARRREREL